MVTGSGGGRVVNGNEGGNVVIDIDGVLPGKCCGVGKVSGSGVVTTNGGSGMVTGEGGGSVANNNVGSSC